NAAHFAGADEQIVGPANVDIDAGDSANRFGRCEPGYQRKKRQTGGGKLRSKKDGNVETLPGSGVPGMIATAATGMLFIGKEDRTMRNADACRGQSVGVGGFGHCGEMEMA